MAIGVQRVNPVMATSASVKPLPCDFSTMLLLQSVRSIDAIRIQARLILTFAGFCYATQMPGTATFWKRCGEATAEDG